MGRKPKPTTLHIRQQTFRPDRHALRPIATGCIAKPADLGRYGSQCWDAAIGFIEAQAGGGECDTHALIGMCRWYDRFRKADQAASKMAAGNTKAWRLMCIAGMAWKHYVHAAKEFGLTPCARTKIKLDEDKQLDELDKLNAS